MRHTNDYQKLEKTIKNIVKSFFDKEKKEPLDDDDIIITWGGKGFDLKFRVISDLWKSIANDIGQHFFELDTFPCTHFNVDIPAPPSKKIYLELTLDAKFKYSELIKAIKDNQCVLLLGPRLATGMSNGINLPLIELLSEKIGEELEEIDNGEYDQKEKHNLLYTAQQYIGNETANRLFLGRTVESFYKDKKPPNIYKILARLPVDLIINTAPDTLMFQALMERKEKEPRIKYYHFKPSVEYKESLKKGIEIFSKDKPIVYNLFGTVDDPDSLVLCEAERIEFINKIIKGKPEVENAIIAKLKEKKFFLFLGFNLEDWHFRLVLKSLELVRGTQTFSPSVKRYPLSPATFDYFKKEFKFTFIDEFFDSDFVEKLPVLLDLPPENGEHPQSKNINIILTYAEEDKPYAEKLNVFLEPLNVKVWSRLSSVAGDENKDLEQEISEADLIIALKSIDFVNNQSSDIEIIKSNYKGDKIFIVKTRAVPDTDNYLSEFEKNDQYKIISTSPQEGKSIEEKIEESKNADKVFSDIIIELQKFINENY